MELQKILCIQVFVNIDKAHYTKMSALCVHMKLHEKYCEKHTKFGGMDKGDFVA